MKKGLRIFLTFAIPAVVVILFWTIPNNFFIALGMGIPSGIGTGILFLLIDYFFTNKRVIKNKFLIRLIIFLVVFTIVTIIHLLLEDGEVIEPLKQLLKEF